MGVPGVVQLIGFPEEGLPDSSAFPHTYTDARICTHKHSHTLMCTRSQELRISCALAQMERLGGVSPVVSPLAQVWEVWMGSVGGVDGTDSLGGVSPVVSPLA
jgi:hypothetical protein